MSMQWPALIFATIFAGTGEKADNNLSAFGDELKLEPPAPKLRNLGDAICHLEVVRDFLDSNGYANEATTIASAVDIVASLHCRARQSTLDQFL